jgi:hypothetical protein
VSKYFLNVANKSLSVESRIWDWRRSINALGSILPLRNSSSGVFIKSWNVDIKSLPAKYHKIDVDVSKMSAPTANPVIRMEGSLSILTE